LRSFFTIILLIFIKKSKFFFEKQLLGKLPSPEMEPTPLYYTIDSLIREYFLVRLAQSPSVPGTSQSDCHWLHPGLRIPQLVRRYSSPRSLLGHYRYTL
jgi:hypothetical protein